MTYRNDLEALAARKQALDVEVAHLSRERDETARLLEEATKRSRLPLLDHLRVAAPCSESWDLMEGDEQVRHCAKCDQDVFNLSAMTRDEAETLVRDKRGNLCARYFQRKDGTIITQNCPVGVRSQRRGLAIAAGAIATVVGGSAVLAATDVEQPPVSVEEPTAFMGTTRATPPLPRVAGSGEMPWGCDRLRHALTQLVTYDANAARALDPIGDWEALEAQLPTMTLERIEALELKCMEYAEAAETATTKLLTAAQKRQQR